MASRSVIISEFLSLSLFADDERTWWQRLATDILKQGPIPRHVALILDGNRTFAKGAKLGAGDGHLKGVKVLTNVVLWLGLFGVEEITTYAFSIENFKRAQGQVSSLMRIFKQLSQLALNEMDMLNANGVRVRVIGDWSMMPKGLKRPLTEVMMLTKQNTRLVINVALAYTGRNEITRAACTLNAGMAEGKIGPEDLSVALADKTIEIGSCSTPPDLLIRTSGVNRLSDFLLWQSTFTIFRFIDTLWPAVSFWDIWKAILHYQIQLQRMKKHKIYPTAIERRCHGEITIRAQAFLDNLLAKYWRDIAADAGCI